jgi:hypothetical protein
MAYDSDEDLGVRGNKLPAATNSGEYEVEKILTKRGEDNHISYTIPDQMKGLPNRGLLFETSFQLEELRTGSRHVQD